MKIKENYLHDALKSDKSDKPNWKENARRQTPGTEHSDATNKFRSADAPLKDEMKFANLLESSAKPAKQTEQREDSGDERRDEQKSDAKREAREKDGAESSAGEARGENYEPADGQAGGQQQGSGFGMNGQVAGLNLNENFAARSILHIADLERLVSTVRTQTALGGKREITLQLKRSVLDGLEIKITTGADAKVQLEFLAANEAVRSQVEKHSEELAGILRGRGVNLETLKTSSKSDSSGDAAPHEPQLESAAQNQFAGADSRLNENTFEPQTGGDGKIYNA